MPAARFGSATPTVSSTASARTVGSSGGRRSRTATKSGPRSLSGPTARSTSGPTATTSANGTPVAVYEAIDILISASAVSDKGTVYFLPDDGTLYAMAANGRLLWTREVAGGDKEVYYASSPVIGPDGTIYVGSWDGGVYAFRGDGPPAATLWPQYRHDAQHTGRTTKPAKGR
jgi:outer membrane protein assembly factor BamB